MAVSAAVMLVSTAVPAVAAVVIDSTNTGYNFVIDYTGKVGGSTTSLIGGLGSFTFNGVTNGGLTYNFGYSVTNDSSVSSRLTAFGFDSINPTISSAASTGYFASANLNNNFPEGFGRVDVCFEADSNGNCTGGSGGLTAGNTGVGTFALTFASVMDSVTIDDFVTRFQSINPSINGSSSGIGVGALVSGGGGGDPIVAPEPGTWMMLLGGFGLVGFAMRRRSGVARQRVPQAV